MNKLYFVLLLAFVACCVLETLGAEDSVASGTVRVKRGYGHGGGGGGGGGHGHGRGGGAAGPVYFCGYVGKTEGYGGYGR